VPNPEFREIQRGGGQNPHKLPSGFLFQGFRSQNSATRETGSN